MPGLERFVTAQDAVWDDVEAELAAGAKRTHWMWFVFPQLAGLGRSATAQHYAIAGPEEARAYLAHPVLGARLRRAAALMLRHRGRTAEAVLGPVDALKLRSSMTLFARIVPEEPLFRDVIAAFYDGDDPRTVALLER